MDNIWRKAAKNICKREERLATIATTTTTPAYTKPTISALTEENMNTVEKIDAQLARMEQNWAKTRSGPFPERTRNTIVKLRASLEEPDTETVPPSHPADPAIDVRHVSTTTTSLSAPAYTATPTTTTTDSNTAASTETTTVAMAATVKLHRTTQDDSEEHEGSEETRRDEIGEGNKETRSAKEKRTEGENEKREAAREGIEES